MNPFHGNLAARAEFAAAMRGDGLHHAWLIAGPEGVGKALFARQAAARLLADAAGEAGRTGDFGLAPESRTAALLAAAAHPDFRLLTRLPNERKPDELARSIPIAQVRGLLPMFATTTSLGPRRVIVIDAIDDVERPGASNALLKSLEEPPAGTIFLLVSHAPGRLLPTIRSRCRVLRFEALGEADMRAVLSTELPEASSEEIEALVRAGEGSPGRALRYAGLDIAAIDAALDTIARHGDTDNRARLSLAKALSSKSAQPRYEAFLDRAPGYIARAARLRRGEDLARAIAAYGEARALAGAARGLSLDWAGTVFEMAGIVARLAAR